VTDASSTGWRKPSYSNGGQQNSCVEVARRRPGGVAVRDSKDPAGPRLAFSAAGWQGFIGWVKSGGPGLA
jgi:hypothetical protein